MFEKGGLGDDLPVVTVTRDELDAGMPAIEAFRRAGLCASNGEARRLIRGGGARINDRPVDSESREIGAGDLNADGVVKLSAGKKRHALIRPA